MTQNGLIQESDLLCAACRLVRTDLVQDKCRNCAELEKSQAAHAEPGFAFWFWVLLLILIILTEPLRTSCGTETD